MTNTIVYNVLKGDTIQGVAQKYGVANWVDLAVMNNMSPPFIVDTLRPENASERLKYVGDPMLVPNTGSATQTKTNIDQVEKEVYGLDLLLFKETDSLEEKFQLTDDGSGDLGVAYGKTNVKQACEIKLTLLRGTLHLHPELGSDFVSSVGKPMSQELIIKLSLEVSRVLKLDYRVDKVLDIKINKASQGSVGITCKVIPIAPLQAFELRV